MKVIIRSAAVLALLLGVTALFASTQVATQPSANSDTENQVRKLNVEELEAFLHHDSKTLARLWSDDFVVTNPLNKFVTKQQVLGMVDSGFLAITSYHRQIEYIRVYGETVIVAGSETVVFGGRMPNAGRTEHLRFTSVWMQQGGRLQQIARHANILPQQ